MIDFQYDIHDRIDLYFSLFEPKCKFYRLNGDDKPILIKKRVSLNEIYSKRRDRPVKVIRRMIWYMLRIKDGFNFEAIGSAFGMDHSSVVKAVQDVEEQIELNPKGLYNPLVNYILNNKPSKLGNRVISHWVIPGLVENSRRLSAN
jgi:hypothetical protein